MPHSCARCHMRWMTEIKLHLKLISSVLFVHFSINICSLISYSSLIKRYLSHITYWEVEAERRWIKWHSKILIEIGTEWAFKTKHWIDKKTSTCHMHTHTQYSVHSMAIEKSDSINDLIMWKNSYYCWTNWKNNNICGQFISLQCGCHLALNMSSWVHIVVIDCYT